MRCLIALIIIGLSGTVWAQVNLTDLEAERWMTAAHDRARKTEDAGLAAFLDALEQTNDMAMHQRGGWIALDAVCQEGWDAGSDLILSELQSHREALLAATEAAQAETIGFPPMEHEPGLLTAPGRPDIEKVEYLFALLVADARRMEAQGDTEGAVARALAALRLAGHWPQGTHPILEMPARRGFERSLLTLESIMSSTMVSDELVLEIEGVLQWVEESRVDSTVFVRRYLEGQLNSLRAVASSEETVRVFVDQVTHDPDAGPLDVLNPVTFFSAEARGRRALSEIFREAYEEAFDDFGAFEADMETYNEAVLENLARPYWEREIIDAEWTRNRSSYQFARLSHLFHTATVFFERGPMKDLVLIARLRLMQALCALHLGETERAAGFTDPFTGTPIRIGEDRLWSLGPDGEDQMGEVEIDLQSGLDARPQGDIVVRRWRVYFRPHLQGQQGDPVFR